MLERFVVVGAAWFEIAVGAIFLVAPRVPCVLLFGATPEGVAMLFARWAGIAPIALGIICTPSTVVGSWAELALLALNMLGGFWEDSKTIVEMLNRLMIGWAHYFCLGPVRNAYSAVDLHARTRLRRWLCDKHNEPRLAYKRFPEAALHSCLAWSSYHTRLRAFRGRPCESFPRAGCGKSASPIR